MCARTASVSELIRYMCLVFTPYLLHGDVYMIVWKNLYQVCCRVEVDTQGASWFVGMGECIILQVDKRANRVSFFNCNK